VKYAHILSYVASTPWAILPEKLHEILAVLAFRASGHGFTDEDIAARISAAKTDTREKVQAINAQLAAAGDGGGRGKAVAVVPLRGIIAHRAGGMDDMSGGASAERFTATFRAAVNDPQVGTILLDVDSPGGTVPGVMEAADAVFEAREQKRIVAVANSVMASAAYWIASQAHELIAIPSALDRSIGSIGVFTAHQDLSAHLEKEGVKVTLIKAGTHKTDFNPFEPLSEELKAELQAMVDATYGHFVKAVARGRGVSVSDVKKGYGEGRALSAPDAKAAGLIDRIDTMEATIGRLIGRSSKPGGMRAEAIANPDPIQGAVIDDAHVHGSPDLLNALVEADQRRRLERF
jgi:signal peptide peptidase SppA